MGASRPIRGGRRPRMSAGGPGTMPEPTARCRFGGRHDAASAKKKTESGAMDGGGPQRAARREPMPPASGPGRVAITRRLQGSWRSRDRSPLGRTPKAFWPQKYSNHGRLC